VNGDLRFGQTLLFDAWFLRYLLFLEGFMHGSYSIKD
jgi:hypothetical protein